MLPLQGLCRLLQPEKEHMVGRKLPSLIPHRKQRRMCRVPPAVKREPRQERSAPKRDGGSLCSSSTQ